MSTNEFDASKVYSPAEILNMSASQVAMLAAARNVGGAGFLPAVVADFCPAPYKDVKLARAARAKAAADAASISGTVPQPATTDKAQTKPRKARALPRRRNVTQTRPSVSSTSPIVASGPAAASHSLSPTAIPTPNPEHHSEATQQSVMILLRCLKDQDGLEEEQARVSSQPAALPHSIPAPLDTAEQTDSNLNVPCTPPPTSLQRQATLPADFLEEPPRVAQTASESFVARPDSQSPLARRISRTLSSVTLNAQYRGEATSVKRKRTDSGVDGSKKTKQGDDARDENNFPDDIQLAMYLVESNISLFDENPFGSGF